MVVFRVIVVCSDHECEDWLEFYGTLPELETLMCDCGYGMQVIGWPDPVDTVEAELPAPAALLAA